MPTASLPNTPWADRAHQLMSLGLLVYIGLFPLGISLREIGSIMAMGGLLAYYTLAWPQSRLKTLRFKWVYLGFFCFIIFKTLHSESVPNSWLALRPNLYKAFPLLLAGIEYPRNKASLNRVIWAFALAGATVGLDGMYQAITGVDFIAGTPIYGNRLTGPLSTPRAGNYISLLIPIALALPLVLPNTMKLNTKYAWMLSLFVLEILFLAGTGTRSGMIGAAASLVALGLITRQYARRLLLLAPVGLVFVAFLPHRFMLATIQKDLRFIEVWPQALDLFQQYPLLGSGWNTFRGAAGLLGDLSPEAIHWPHPHNIYLQFLCEGGILGLVVLLLFLFGTLTWIATTLRKASDTLAATNTKHICAILLASACGYSVTAISAHNFFRTWWLGAAFTIIGLAIGASQLMLSQTDD